jgi:hypothetical protein
LPGPANCHHNGYASSAPEVTAATPSPAATRPATAFVAPQAIAAYAITNTPSVSAVKSRTSSLMKTCNTISSPSTTPPRTTRPCSRSRRTCHTMNGTTHWLTKLMCPLACDTIAGQNPHHRPPTQAANRLRTTYRASTPYQAAAVPARPSVSSRTIETPGPKTWVIGATGRASARIEVLAIMLTPSGTFSRSVKNGLSPWNSTRSPCDSTNRKKPWSSSLCDSTRPSGSSHSRISTSTASSG